MHTPKFGVICSSPSPLSAKLCSMSVHRSVQEFEFHRILIRQIIHQRHTWDRLSRLSVECTTPTLVSICSFSSPLSAKFCSMSVHQSVKGLEFYRITGRLTHKQRHNWQGHSRLSVQNTSPTLVSTCSSPSALSAKLCSMRVYRSIQEFEFYCLLRRLMPKSYTRGIVGITLVGCPSNAHLEIWCQPAPLHHLCLLNFVPWVCIDPFKSLNFAAYSAGYNTQIIPQRQGRSRLSVKYTLRSLVSISSSQSFLSAKHRSMSVH